METQVLKKTLERAIKDIDHKAVSPVLRGVLVEQVGGELRLTTANLGREHALTRYRVPNNGPRRERKGAAVLLDPRRLVKWLRAARKDGGEVTIQISKKEIAFGRDGRTLTMAAAAADEFPDTSWMRQWDENSKRNSKRVGSVNGEVLARYGPALAVSAADDDRPYLSAVWMQDDVCFSSDGRRLNLLTIPEVEETIRIPVGMWKRLMEEVKGGWIGEEETVWIHKLAEDGRLILVYAGCIRTVAAEQCDPFPAKDVIPKDHAVAWTPDPDALRQALKEILAVADVPPPCVNLRLDGGTYRLEHKSGDGARYASEPLGTAKRKGKGEKKGTMPTPAFNGRYMLDLFLGFEHPTFRLPEDELTGVMIVEEGSPLTHVLMPLRT